MYIKNVNIVHWLHEGEGDMKIWDMKIYPPKKICISRRYHLREISNTLSSHKSWLLIFFFLVDGGGFKLYFSQQSWQYLFIYSPNCCTKQINPMVIETRWIIAAILFRFCTLWIQFDTRLAILIARRGVMTNK